LELLDPFLILSRMDHQIREALNDLKIEDSLDSTNAALQRLPPETQHCTAILAEQQNAGRGRRGKNWHSPYAKNLYLSLGWRFDQELTELGCLPLVVALAAAEALSQAGLAGHIIKWPNDLLLDGKKLCGCLTEVQGDLKGPCHAVLGVGINVNMPSTDIIPEIDQAWTDLASHLPDCSRNSLAALLLEQLIIQLTLFSEQGFDPFRLTWQERDGLFGQPVDVVSGNRSFQGVAAGIDKQGALLLHTGHQVISLHSADVSLRLSQKS
jgi:BirA family biotin operon repressor/biotin-[acetyl-CoA-carboxylase] ligase